MVDFGWALKPKIGVLVRKGVDTEGHAGKKVM